MSEEDPTTSTEHAAEDLTDEIAAKYDPERLLKMFSKKAGRRDPLDPTTRAKYEQRFGVDLGHVRVITGEFAEEFNRKREAYAVTIGATGLILMGGSPDKAAHTAAGQGLLAHELTHVAQAQKGLHRSGQFDNTMQFTQEHEQEAHAVEADVASGGQGSSAAGGDANQAAMASEKKQKEMLEKVKKRVVEIMGDAERNQWMRNGGSRRA